MLQQKSKFDLFTPAKQSVNREENSRRKRLFKLRTILTLQKSGKNLVMNKFRLNIFFSSSGVF